MRLSVGRWRQLIGCYEEHWAERHANSRWHRQCCIRSAIDHARRELPVPDNNRSQLAGRWLVKHSRTRTRRVVGSRSRKVLVQLLRTCRRSKKVSGVSKVAEAVTTSKERFIKRYKPPRRFAPCRLDADGILGRSRLHASKTHQLWWPTPPWPMPHPSFRYLCEVATVNQWRADLQHNLATRRLTYRCVK